MSLQVWLPLNGNLQNKGLADVNVTNNGATINNSGKIGKCYSFNGTNNYITIPVNVIKNLTKDFSFCFWAKFLSFNTSYQTVFSATASNASWANEIICFQRNASTNYFLFTVANGSSYTATTLQTGTLAINTWYHFVCTYQTAGRISIYQNGNLISSHTISFTPGVDKIQNFNLGRSHTGYYSNMLLNDFRIYNYALSKKEIKEISKGLVLHYPLDNNGLGFINPNLLKNTRGSSGSAASGITRTITSEGYVKIVASSSNNNWVTFYCNNTLPISQGNTFTFSVKIRSDDSIKKPKVYFQSGMGYYSMQGTMSSNWSIIYYTGTWSIENLQTNMHLGFSSAPGTYYIEYIKLEAGNIITPWCPNENDQLYDILGYNQNIIYDTSGYQNNGELYSYNTYGSIENDNNTPRYITCTFINSDSNTTNTASGTRYIYGHCQLTNPTAMTIAFWCKPLGGYGGGGGQGQFCTTNYKYGNTNAGSDYLVSAMNHRDSAIDINDSTSNLHCRPSFSPILNEWHHYVITCDGQVGKVYKDGVVSSTAQFSSPQVLGSFIGVIIGFSKAGGVWRSNKTYYSDFRLYCTCLSDQDILELYHTTSSIDKDQNVYIREIRE